MAHALALCVRCEARPRRTPHRNTKYCDACRQQLLTAPQSRVTAAQGAMIQALRGTMPRGQLAARVGISHAQLNRYLREQGLRSNARDYPQEVVEAVAHAYEAAPPKQGMATVRALFPDVVVRSIVERRQHHRPIYQPRQTRWTGEQLLDAVRMAGLVSHQAQARYFGRPNAFAGSVKSLWRKHFRCPPRAVNGLPFHLAWPLTTPGVSAVLVAQQGQHGPAAKVLWLDLVPFLQPDLDPTIRRAVQVLARFQAWLQRTHDTATIRQMIAERETTYGDRFARDDEWPDASRDHARRPVRRGAAV